MDIYKKGQGTIARWVAAGGMGGFAVFGCYELQEYVARFTDRALSLGFVSMPVSVLASFGAFVAAAVVIGVVVNSKRFVDYLIMSEVELRKVSWPSRADLKRQTVAVIVTLLFFSVILLVADVVFVFGSSRLYGF